MERKLFSMVNLFSWEEMIKRKKIFLNLRKVALNIP